MQFLHTLWYTVEEHVLRHRIFFNQEDCKNHAGKTTLFSLHYRCTALCLFRMQQFCGYGAPKSASAETKVPEMRDISTTALVQDMGIGINLGNTFESCGDWIEQWGDGSVESYETAWGSPVITQEMIEGYAAEGRKAFRSGTAYSTAAED